MSHSQCDILLECASQKTLGLSFSWAFGFQAGVYEKSRPDFNTAQQTVAREKEFSPRLVWILGGTMASLFSGFQASSVSSLIFSFRLGRKRT